MLWYFLSIVLGKISVFRARDHFGAGLLMETVELGVVTAELILSWCSMHLVERAGCGPSFEGRFLVLRLLLLGGLRRSGAGVCRDGWDLL